MKFKHYNINDKINIRGIGLGTKVGEHKFQTVEETKKGTSNIAKVIVHVINPESHVINDPVWMNPL